MNGTAGLHAAQIVLLCTIHLLAGLGVGILLTRGTKRKARPSRIARLEKSLRLYRDGVLRLRKQASDLSSMMMADGRSIPAPLIVAAHALARAAKELQENTQRSPASAPRLMALCRKEEPAMSRSEIRRVLSLSHPDSGLVSEELETEWHTYQIGQWMGRCVGSRLPAPEDFERVLCHDLSQKGVSFYADDVQIGQNVVIAIGVGDSPMFVVAEVMNRRLVTSAEKLTYLTGCRFRRRLSPQTDGEVLAGYCRLVAEKGAERTPV